MNKPNGGDFAHISRSFLDLRQIPRGVMLALGASKEPRVIARPVGSQRRVTRVSATLYAVHTSHPSHAARLMLEHKGIEHEVVNLVPGTHPAAVRARGFQSGTVPALRLAGRRIQGTRAISRALDEAQPEPPLFPVDPQQRIRVEQAELWGDDILQPVPRRIGGWVFANRPEMRTRLAREAGLPVPRLLGLAGRPVTWCNARKVGANDTEQVRATVEMLLPLLDHVDDLLNEGTIGGEQRNAADFQIGTSVRLLVTFADLAPALEGREATRFATALMPHYPTGVPAGLLPQEWLEPLRG
jgi:glutathione S-transferase